MKVFTHTVILAALLTGSTWFPALGQSQSLDLQQLLKALPQINKHDRQLVVVSLKTLLTYALLTSNQIEIAQHQVLVAANSLKQQSQPFLPTANFKTRQARTFRRAANAGDSYLLVQRSDSTVNSASLDWQTRLGIGLGFSFERTTTKDADIIQATAGGKPELDASSTSKPAYQDQLAFKVNIPLFQDFGGGAQRHAENKASLNVQKSVYAYEKSARQYIELINNYYWDLVANYKSLELQEQKILTSEELLRQGELRYEIGDIDATALLEHESRLAQDRQLFLAEKFKIINIENLIKNALSIKNLPLGLYPEDLPQLHDYTQETLDQMWEKTKNTHPDLKTLLINRQENQQDYLLAKNTADWNIDLSFQYNLNGFGNTASEAQSQYSNKDLTGNQVQLSWSIPIPNVQGQTALKQNQLQRLQVELLTENEELKLKQTLQQTLNALNSNEQQIEALEIAEILATDLLAKRLEQHTLGLVTTLELNQARTNVAATQLSLIRSFSAQEKLYLKILLLTGEIFDYFEFEQPYQAEKFFERLGTP